MITRLRHKHRTMGTEHKDIVEVFCIYSYFRDFLCWTVKAIDSVLRRYF